MGVSTSDEDDDTIDLRGHVTQDRPTPQQMIDYLNSIEGGTLRDRLMRMHMVRFLQSAEMMVE